MTLKEGYKLQEFEIKSVLGQGGFGITYLAFDTLLKKDVAIKEFFPKDLVSRDESDNTVSLQKIEGEGSEDKRDICITRYKHFLKKFEKEAQIMAELDHTNIVKVIRYLEENNTGYFVMNYIKGESLKKYIQRVGKLTQEQILEIIIPVLEGLKAVHSKDFLHRDIAPDNIFLTQNGKSMLLDFGAAKSTITDPDGEEVSIGVVKKSYSAPEQFYDDSIHTVATDIYSVGAVIVFCLTANMPPPAPKRSNEDNDPLKELLEFYKSECTQGFIQAIIKAMNLQAKNRFQEVIELQKSLIIKSVTNDKSRGRASLAFKKNKIYIGIFIFIGIAFFFIQNILGEDRKYKTLIDVIPIEKKLNNIVYSKFINQKIEDVSSFSKEKRAFLLGVKYADAHFLAIEENPMLLHGIVKNIRYLQNKIILNERPLALHVGKYNFLNLEKTIQSKKWTQVLEKIKNLNTKISNIFVDTKQNNLKIFNDVGFWIERYRLAVEKIHVDYHVKDTDILVKNNLSNYFLLQLKNLKKTDSNVQFKLVKALMDINKIIPLGSKIKTLSKVEVLELSKILTNLELIL